MWVICRMLALGLITFIHSFMLRVFEKNRFVSNRSDNESGRSSSSNSFDQVTGWRYPMGAFSLTVQRFAFESRVLGRNNCDYYIGDGHPSRWRAGNVNPIRATSLIKTLTKVVVDITLLSNFPLDLILTTYQEDYKAEWRSGLRVENYGTLQASETPKNVVGQQSMSLSFRVLSVCFAVRFISISIPDLAAVAMAVAYHENSPILDVSHLWEITRAGSNRTIHVGKEPFTIKFEFKCRRFHIWRRWSARESDKGKLSDIIACWVRDNRLRVDSCRSCFAGGTATNTCAARKAVQWRK